MAGAGSGIGRGVSGHTDLNDSVADATILEELEKRLPAVEIDCLDRLYPDFRIDVDAEQRKRKLLAAGIIVFQPPVFWRSSPSLLHCWIEQTFQHGFSHAGALADMKTRSVEHARRWSSSSSPCERSTVRAPGQGPSSGRRTRSTVRHVFIAPSEEGSLGNRSRISSRMRLLDEPGSSRERSRCRADFSVEPEP